MYTDRNQIKRRINYGNANGKEREENRRHHRDSGRNCTLCLLCPGGIAILAGLVNNSNVGFTMPQWSGAAFLCLSVIFIVIAVLVPVLTLRKKKAAPEAASVDVLPGEPLPPAS
jgi:membrane protein implicated in regulation of membrane protease activity